MEPMFECLTCGLRYYVVWANDGGGPPNDYCPRCGCEDLNLPEEVEED